jgi:hypothetical protein
MQCPDALIAYTKLGRYGTAVSEPVREYQAVATARMVETCSPRNYNSRRNTAEDHSQYTSTHHQECENPALQCVDSLGRQL